MHETGETASIIGTGEHEEIRSKGPPDGLEGLEQSRVLVQSQQLYKLDHTKTSDLGFNFPAALRSWKMAQLDTTYRETKIMPTQAALAQRPRLNASLGGTGVVENVEERWRKPGGSRSLTVNAEIAAELSSNFVPWQLLTAKDDGEAKDETKSMSIDGRKRGKAASSSSSYSSGYYQKVEDLEWRPSLTAELPLEAKEVATSGKNVMFWKQSDGSTYSKGERLYLVAEHQRPVFTLSRRNLEINNSIGDSELWSKISTSGMFLLISSNIRSLLDLQPENLAGTSIQELMWNESRADFGRAVEKARRGKIVTCKHEVQNCRGQVLQAQIILYPVDAGTSLQR
ncbi:hypothetical protein G7046_g8049 [Stylonectria norvegica]|nr:hypothetical protein G7046_g8049 [Stylonectria norvegica]